MSKDDEGNDKVKLDDKEISKEELKEAIDNTPAGKKIAEVEKDTYKTLTRIKG